MPHTRMDPRKVRDDFDEIARLADGESGTDRYHAFLMSLVPRHALRVLDVGCGLGGLTAELAKGDRQVTAIDLSPEMIERARQRLDSPRVSFLCANFLDHDFGTLRFDCIISAATIHHMPEHDAVSRMRALLRPGGRLVIHDLRADVSILDRFTSHAAFALVAFGRLLRTGSPGPARAVRDAWVRHGAAETYLTSEESRALANRLLPRARVFHHRCWRYTIVWDQQSAS
jgi:2-polyprenyl-3-methyl-5-hydroxy-6-metoxy-1,4-benzoquinol methylase